MTLFIDMGGECVNLAMVARIATQYAKGFEPTHSLYAADGKLIRRFSDRDFSPAAFTAPVVPAAAGQTAVVITFGTEFGARPEASDIIVEHQQIIAWRIHYGHDAEAILPEEPPSNGVVLITMPDGKLMRPGIETFDGLEDAKEILLGYRQAEWEQNVRMRQSLHATGGMK